MFKRLKRIFKVVFGPKNDTEESKRDDLKTRTLVSFSLLGVSLLLTIINIVTKKEFMMWTTLGLTGIFAISCFLLIALKARIPSEILTIIGICFIFSYYAYSGENDGFAILWIIIVPAIAALFVSYGGYVFVSLYFLALLIAMFYTPLKEHIPAITEGIYNEQFQIRFPVLYFASLFLSFILSTQAIYYSTVSHNNSLFDFLTGLKNRRFCSDYVQRLSEDPLSPTLTIFSMDMNNLKSLNDSYGHDAGDEAIVATARLLEKVFAKKTDKIYRLGGDEFLVIIDDKDNKTQLYLERIKEECEKVKIQSNTLSLSIGHVKAREYIKLDVHELIRVAENNMYKDKEEFYKKNNVDRRRKSNLKIDIN